MPPTFTIVDTTPRIVVDAAPCIAAPGPAATGRRTRRKRPAYQALIRMSDRRLAEKGLVRVVMAGVLLVARRGTAHPALPVLRRPCNSNRPVHLC